jgi:hypothetical protein
MAWATRGGAVFTGWSDKQFAGVTVDGGGPAPAHKAFLIVHLPLSTRGSTVLIPYGTAQRAVTEEKGTSRTAYYEGGIDIWDGFITTEFRLPTGAGRLTIDRLEVTCDHVGAPGGAKLQVYNWRTSAWDTLPRASGAVPVPDPQAHIDSTNGVVRVKFVHHPTSGLPGGTGIGRGVGQPMAGQCRLQVLDVLVKGRR